MSNLNFRLKATTDYIVQYGHRLELIEWLEWNDPNGCYSDADCELEDMEPLDDDTLRSIMRTQLADSEQAQSYAVIYGHDEPVQVLRDHGMGTIDVERLRDGKCFRVSGLTTK